MLSNKQSRGSLLARPVGARSFFLLASRHGGRAADRMVAATAFVLATAVALAARAIPIPW